MGVVAKAAYLQPPGLGPAPPLTVDALVTLPNEEHPGIPGIHTVCMRHGRLLGHRRPRAGWFALWCCLAAAWTLSLVFSEVASLVSPSAPSHPPAHPQPMEDETALHSWESPGCRKVGDGTL